MSFLQQFILILVPTIGGGLLSAYVVSKLTARRDEVEHRKTKAESIYELVCDDHVKFTKWYIANRARFEGYQVSVRARKAADDGPARKAKLTMLATLYLDRITSSMEIYYRRKIEVIKLVNDLGDVFNSRAALEQSELNQLAYSFERYKAAHFELQQAIVAATHRL